MASEIVETSRLYARTIANIEPEWLEKVGAHLIKKSWSDPHWEKNAGNVIAFEKGTLYSLPVYGQRRVNFAPKDAKLARKFSLERLWSMKILILRRLSGSTTNLLSKTSETWNINLAVRMFWSMTSRFFAFMTLVSVQRFVVFHVRKVEKRKRSQRAETAFSSLRRI